MTQSIESRRWTCGRSASEAIRQWTKSSSLQS